MKKLLLHLDTDPVASTFDQVVAYDSGVDNILTRAAVSPDNVTSYVHGMMFTRSSRKLKHSAIFIGGSNVEACDKVAEAVKGCFFGPVRVSVMLDPNGSNTTAAAVARKVIAHYDVQGKHVVILGSGPVGQRAALYFIQEGAASVTLTSRRLDRASAITKAMKSRYNVDVTPAEVNDDASTAAVLAQAHVAVAAGPTGVCMIPQTVLDQTPSLAVVADVNAVPPLGIAGIDLVDDGTEKGGKRFYGALAIGALKMQIHRKAVAALFEANDIVLDETSIYEIASQHQ